MAVQNSLTQISDGDQLNSGYFNENGFFYVGATDSSGSDHTHNAESWALKRTFAFTGLSTNYHIIGLELENLSLTHSENNAYEEGLLGIIITDGTTYLSPSPLEINTVDNPIEQIFINSPPCWEAVSAGTPKTILQSSVSNKPVTIGKLSIPIPINSMTGVTSYSVLFYLYSNLTVANTVTLTKGFKVRLIVCKRPQDLGTSVVQS